MFKIAFQNCNLIDVSSGNIVSGTDIVIQNEFISDIGEGTGNNADFKIDASGLWAIPGLIDIHVHICDDPHQNDSNKLMHEAESVTLRRSFHNLSEALNCGITTVRDAGSPHARSILVKRAIDNGAASFPTLYSCGKIITYPNGHMAEYGIEARGIEAINKAVEKNVELGADYIKIASDPEDNEAKGRFPDPTFNLDELKCIVSNAQKNKMRVACHTYPSIKGVQRAIDAGINTIEHAVPLEGVHVPKSYCEKITFVPTFVSAYDVMPLETILSKMSLDFERVKAFEETNIKYSFENVPESIAEWFDRLILFLPKAIRNGCRIAIGSDAGCAGTNFKSAIREMFLLTQLGASNLQVLQYATINAAEALGNKILGKLEPNFVANIVFCNRDPTLELEGLLNCKIVVLNGSVVKFSQ